MKRIIPFMVIVAMLLSMGFSAAATEQGEHTKDVYGKYEAGEASEQIITVDIDWEGMNFTYNGETKVWDPQSHKYTEYNEGGWSQSDAKIKFTNHSNLILQAGITYESNPDYKDMGLAFTQNQPYIGSAATGEGTAAGNPYEVVIQAVPTGKLPEDTKANTVVGEIKVTVTPVENHLVVLGTLESIYGEIPLKDNAHNVGDAYYDTADDITALTELFDEAMAEAVKTGNEAQKNVTLNAFLTAFYSKLRLVPDKTVD